MANNISLSDILHNRPAVVPTIYCYCLPGVTDHDGYIKVGYTDRVDVDKRIREQLHTAALNCKVLLKESAMRSDGTCFTDKDVHRILRRKGFAQLKAGADRFDFSAPFGVLFKRNIIVIHMYLHQNHTIRITQVFRTCHRTFLHVKR